MSRAAALIVLVALTAAPVRQLTCVWECGEPAASLQSASCHETAAQGPAMAASDAACPFNPDPAVFATGAASEPQRNRAVVAIDRPGVAPHFVALHTLERGPTGSPGQRHGPYSRTLSALRI